MSFQSSPTPPQPTELGCESLPIPLSSDEVVSAEDVENLHAIISNSHLEDDEEQLLREELEKELQGEFSEGTSPLFDETDAEYLPYARSGGNVVVSFNIWDILRKGAINLVLPFINGIMLGFGEILAHEIGFRYGFFGARVQPPRRLEERRKSRFL
ncbi:hypothetical protein JCM33374_g5207 [Metschnikowia sp. JCM 33374]|nr:hypothetical protein JCM33374_g5207 [Metschnikowia sp. JCM 33374]